MIADIKSNNHFIDGEVYKCKIGKYSIQEEIKILKKILTEHSINLRLDGNRKLSQHQLAKYFPLISLNDHSCIDYFEEPLENLFNYQGASFPLALDESFHSFEQLVQSNYYVIKSIIYKPTIMGGVSTLLNFIKTSPIKGLPISLSSSYEGHVGHDFLKLLACYIDSIGPGARHGLVHIE